MVQTTLQQNVQAARKRFEDESKRSETSSANFRKLQQELQQRRKQDPTFFGSKFRQSELAGRLARAERERQLLSRSRGQAKRSLIEFRAQQQKAAGQLTSKQLRKQRVITKVKKGLASFVKDLPTGKKKQLTKSQRSDIDRLKKLTKGAIKDLPTPAKKKDIRKLLGLKPIVVSKSAFSKEDLKVIAQSQNPTQAIKALRQLQKSQEKASIQKIQSFLKVSLKEVTSQKDVNIINKAINKQVKRQEDKGLQRDLAVASVLKEVKLIKQGLKTGKLSLSGLKSFGVNAVNGFIGIFTAPIIGSFNYGKNLVKRGLWDNTNANPIVKDVKKVIVGGSINAAKAASFLVNNPTEAQIIVGVAAATAGASLLGAFRKNPGTTFGQSLAILFPGEVIKGTLKAGQVSLKGVKVTTKTGKAKVLKLFAKDVKVLKKTKVDKVNLILQSNLRVGQKKEALYKLIGSTQFKTLPLKEFKKLNFEELEKLLPSTKGFKTKLESKIKLERKAKIETKIKAIKKKIKSKIIKKTPKSIKFIVGTGKKFTKAEIAQINRLTKLSLSKTSKAIKTFFVGTGKKFTKSEIAQIDRLTKLPSGKIVTGFKRFIVGTGKKFTTAEIAQINRLTKLSSGKRTQTIKRFFVGTGKKFSKADIEQIDRLTKLPLKKGIRIGFPGKKGQLKIGRQLQQESKQIKDRTSTVINDAFTLKKGDIVRFRIGDVQTINKQANQVLKRVKNATKNKSLSKSIASNLKLELINSVLRLNLGFLLIKKLDKTNLRIPNSRIFKSIFSQARATEQLRDKDTVKDVVQAKDFKRIFARIFDRIRIQVQPLLKKPQIRPKLKPARPVRKLPKKFRIRIPKLKFLPKKGSRTGYIIRIKEGNKIVSQSTDLLPRNRARNLERTILDNNLRASGEIVVKGRTSIVDVKKLILGRKFRPKRSKDPKVRPEVEKRKFRLDTPGERKRKGKKSRKPLKRLKSKKRIGKKK